MRAEAMRAVGDLGQVAREAAWAAAAGVVTAMVVAARAAAASEGGSGEGGGGLGPAKERVQGCVQTL